MTKKNVSIPPDWEEGSVNVFADLNHPEADEKLAKIELAHQINCLIKQKGLKQAEAARLLGIDQAKISALRCGQLSIFSLERLARYLILLGQEVEILIRPLQPFASRRLHVSIASNRP